MADCKVVRAGEAVSGKQGLLYAHGISSETAASRGLCMHRLTIPAGQYGLAHLHEAHESAIFVLEGEAVFWWGEARASRGLRAPRLRLRSGRRPAPPGQPDGRAVRGRRRPDGPGATRRASS